MWPKRLGGIFAGIIVALVIMIGAEYLGHMMWPPPAGIDLKDPKVLESMMDKIPTPAKIAVIVAWFLGARVGGWTALKLSNWPPSVWIICGLVLLGTAMTLFAIPHPVWMAGAGLVAPLLAGGLVLGSRGSRAAL